MAHTPSANTKALSLALLGGAESMVDNSQIQCVMKTPFETTSQDVLSADGLIIFTTENFGYMAGAVKDFFDRTYYQLIEASNGLPYALAIRAGLDGTGTKRAVHKIVSGLKWRLIQDTLICKGEYSPDFEDQCRILGATVAALLDNDLV